MTDESDAPKDNETRYISKSGTAYTHIKTSNGGYFERAEKSDGKTMSGKETISGNDMVYAQESQVKEVIKEYRKMFPDRDIKKIPFRKFIGLVKKITEGVPETKGGRFYYKGKEGKKKSDIISNRIPPFEEPSAADSLEALAGGEAITLQKTNNYEAPVQEPTPTIEDYDHQPKEPNFENLPGQTDGDETPKPDSDDIKITPPSSSDDTDTIPYDSLPENQPKH